MKKLQTQVILIGLILISTWGLTQDFKKDPYILFQNQVENPNNYTPEIKDLMIRWQFENTTTCSLKWKEVNASEFNDGVIDNTVDNIHSCNIPISSLVAGAKYEYKVYINEIEKANGTFLAPPLPNATEVSFYAYGDTRTSDSSNNYNNDVCERIVEEIESDLTSQTLLLHAGDWINNDTEDTWQNNYFNPSHDKSIELRSLISTMGVIGNHETYGNSGNNGEIYKKYWPYSYDDINPEDPIKNFNYSFDYGPIHFIFVSLIDGNATLSVEQEDWITNDLSTTTKPWKVMVQHCPTYSASFQMGNLATQQFCEDYGVQLVIEGHIHYYAHWLDNGVHHLTLGGGGVVDESKPNWYAGAGEFMSYIFNHFAKINIKDNMMGVVIHSWEDNGNGEYVWNDDFDTFTLPITYTIKSGENVVWEDSGVRFYADNIVVKDGGSLTIKGDIEFKKDAGIVVRSGGQLTLDGATLSCLGDYSEEKHWQGIQVLGDPFSPNLADQGKLILKNNATIKNAEVAVRNFFIEGGYNTGGIVQATEANFINNKTSIQLKLTHYDLANNYYSSFVNCTFEVNQNYQVPNSFEEFADLNSVNDVIFNDCEFLMENSMHQGTGINAAYSNVIVNNHCSFDNLQYGIHLTGDSHTFGSRVETSTFTDIERGIYVGGINEMEITDNNFYIPLSMEPGSSNTYGLYMERCDGYVIEDDTCVSLNPSSKTTIGFYVKNSGRNNNQVYRNVFKDLTYGAIAYGRNRHPDEPGGLCFKCNTFTANDYDIAVFGNNSEDGIKPNQGSGALEATAPAGNRFSNTTNSVGLDNQAAHFTYWYPDNTTVIDVVPNTYLGDITLSKNFIPNWTIEKGCPPSHGGGSGGTTTESERSAMASNEAKSDSTQNILDLLVDGGDTQGTTQEVETAYPPETYEVYNELMNKSPYLSDKVVKASIEKEEVLPNVMIRDIMVANPQSAKEQELLDKVDERSNPMPDYMKAQILAGKDLIGYMEKLEAEKSHYAQKRANAYHNLIRLYQQDSLLTTEAKLDSVIVLVSAENTLSAQYRLAMLYFAKGDYVAGQNVLAAIPNVFTLNAEQSTEHSYFTDYYQIATDLAISNDTITTQQIADLEYIVGEEAGLSAAYARNLLIAHNVMDYVEEVLIPEGLHFAAHPQEEALQEALEAHNYLSLFPNPAKDYLIVKYELEMEYADAQLQIYDSKGSLIKTIAAENIQDQKVISTTDLKAGTYYIHLYFNHKEMESQKFTVVK